MDFRSTAIPGSDPGFQSGHETQFLFLEGDVPQSDADEIRLPADGKSFIPQSIKLS